jgi:hypothetical protein
MCWTIYLVRPVVHDAAVLGSNSTNVMEDDRAVWHGTANRRASSPARFASAERFSRRANGFCNVLKLSATLLDIAGKQRAFLVDSACAGPRGCRRDLNDCGKVAS